jgi:hypothetical protein
MFKISLRRILRGHLFVVEARLALRSGTQNETTQTSKTTIDAVKRAPWYVSWANGPPEWLYANEMFLFKWFKNHSFHQSDVGWDFRSRVMRSTIQRQELVDESSHDNDANDRALSSGSTYSYCSDSLYLHFHYSLVDRCCSSRWSSFFVCSFQAQKGWIQTSLLYLQDWK